MSEPLVTIRTSCYNHEEYLDDYFNSIIGQTYNNIELILIDDASKDSSTHIIEEWMPRLKKRFKQVTYIPRKTNIGLVPNVIDAMKIAKGKYIVGFASDDVMEPERIQLQVEFLENNFEYKMVYTDCYIIDEFGTIKLRRGSRVSFKEGHIFNELFTHEFYIPAPTVMIYTEILNEIGYEEKFKVEDWILWCQVSHKYKIAYLDKPLSQYRIHSNNMHKNHSMMYQQQKEMLNYIAKKLNVEEKLFKVALNNLEYRQSQNYSIDIIRAKLMFIKGIYLKLRGQLSLDFELIDFARFVFKWSD